MFQKLKARKEVIYEELNYWNNERQYVSLT